MTSILISGVDLVGKTTLLQNLNRVLSDQGYSVISNSHELVKTPFSERAHELMHKDPKCHEKEDESAKMSLDINGLLAIGFLIDGSSVCPAANQVVIQDSYYHRVIAFNEVNKLPYIAQVLRYASQKGALIRFDINIFLTASIEERRRRFHTKEKVDCLDEDVFSRPDHVLRFESILEELVSTEPRYVRIDSTALTPEQVTTMALQHIKPSLPLFQKQVAPYAKT